MRAYATEMAGLIDVETSRGPYRPREVADLIIETLRTCDPDLLHGWLDVGASDFLYEEIDRRDRSVRANLRRSVRRGVFAEAASAFEDGDEAPLRGLLDMPLTVADGRRRRLGELNGTELEFVAGGYDRRARDNAFWATFFRVLAEKVGPDPVENHYTEEALKAMFQGFA
jgi:hypothetical protein